MRKKNITFIFVLFLTISVLTSTIVSYSLDGSKTFENTELPTLDDQYNATSPTDFFNETTYPRYALAARPIGEIKYPNKVNPAIALFGEEIKLIVSGSSSALNWNFTLIDANVSFSLDVLGSEYKEDTWYFDAIPEIQREGLYDLQLNFSEGDDYQTHAIQLLEEQHYPFTFAHVSDTHFPAYYEEFNTTGVNLQEIENIKALDPDFILVTGDLIHAATRYFLNPETGEPMSSAMQYKLAIWALDLFDKPVFYIHGNHEFSQINYLPDDPSTQYYRYFGEINYQNFTYLDWTFVGYSAEWPGLSQEDLDTVYQILSQNSDGATVLYHHYDFADQAYSMLKKFPIEVVLYGHIHQEDLYMHKDRLYHQQAPLFEHEFTIFSILNETCIEVDAQTFNFELLPYVPPTDEPTTPTDESIVFGPLIMMLGLMVYYFVKRKK
ncbi:MAG: metallophosphoesterase family protein [Candidatus Heimdallarchaeaceae archaeon]